LLLTMNVVIQSGRPVSRHGGLHRDAEALHKVMSDLVRIYQFRDRDRICCYDISVTQCYALEALAEHGPLRLGALAERMYLDKSTTSRVVRTLVRKGYAEQGPEAGDRRAVAIAATRSGRRLFERITSGLIEQQKLVMQDIDPKVRAGVVEVLRRLSRTADARFRSGVSVRDAAGACCGASASPTS
jgi:MarR family transcriptional regulator, 2-MHQ and catechol-resistance regulon repressor